MVMIHVAVVAALPLRLSGKIRRAVEFLPLVLLVALPLQHGLPSIQEIRTDLRAKFEVGYRDVVDARATHVAGDYWLVWPAVFAANWRLHEEEAGRTVWGLSHRSAPTEMYWRATPKPEIRAATFEGDSNAGRYLNLLAEHWTEIERRGPMVIQRVKE